MSLTHGHYFTANRIQENLDKPLKGLLERNKNEYLLGAVGPDVAYWADYLGDKLPLQYDVDFEHDLHVHKTGELIQKLLRDHWAAWEQDQDLHEPILAFILGWITHWVTDIYVHTLVDLYGGNYNTQQPRHVQLELVETKCLILNRPELVDFTVQRNEEVFRFLGRGLAAAYPEARVKRTDNKGADMGIPGRLEMKPIGEQLDWFVCCMDHGLAVVNLACSCAKQGCDNGTGKAPGYEKLAQWAWGSKGAYIPSKDVYENIIHPLKSREITMEQNAMIAEITVKDTGLYGKFLIDYEQFAAAAIDKATSLFREIGGYVSPYIGEDATSKEKAPQARRAAKKFAQDAERQDSIEKLFKLNGKDIDILIPEGFMREYDPQAMKYIVDGTRRGPGDSDEASFEFKYDLADGASETRVARAKIENMQKQELFGSRSGAVYVKPQIRNPKDLDYTCTLKVSLTDEKAFDVPEFDQYEYMAVGCSYKAAGKQKTKEKVSALSVDMELSGPWKVNILNASCDGNKCFDVSLIGVIPEGYDKGVKWNHVALEISGNINRKDPEALPPTVEEYGQLFNKLNGCFATLRNAGSLSVGKLSGVYAEGQGEASSPLTGGVTCFYRYNANLSYRDAWVNISGSCTVEASKPEYNEEAKSRLTALAESVRGALKGVSFKLASEKIRD